MQAARGASLNDPAEEPVSPVDPAGTVSRVPLVLTAAATVLVLDVGSKALAVAELTDREPISLLGGLLTLRLVRNPGAAFGMAQGLTILFTLVALAVVVVILRLARRLQSAWWAAALGLVLGGALGNLLDRLLRSPGPGRGHVVDFLELPRWPVFNLADSAIVVAALLMVALTARGVPHGAERAETGQTAADVDPDRGPRKPE
jgi:signal peptidase II